MKNKLLLLTVLLASLKLSAQLSLPPNGGNQKSIIRQYIGPVAFVEIVYNSPDVDGRTGNIWGYVVNYGMFNQDFGKSTEENPSPWRAGANENTTIEFSHDALFQGEEVPAGKYSLHMITSETGLWTMILNRETRAWGSYFYEPSLDVVRVSASPEQGPFREYLSYEFVERKASSATAALFWENIMVPFSVAFPNNNEIILSTVESELKSFQAFQSRNWSRAAEWASSEGFHEKALEWVNFSINDPSIGEQNFRNVNSKVAILLNSNDADQAFSLVKEMISDVPVTPRQIHEIGGRFLRKNEKEKAFEIFRLNYNTFKGVWPTNVGLARAYASEGNFKKSIKHLIKAKENIPGQNPNIAAHIDDLIAKAEKGEDFN